MCLVSLMKTHLPLAVICRWETFSTANTKPIQAPLWKVWNPWRAEVFSPAPGLLVDGLWECGFRDAQAFWTFQPFFLHRITLQTVCNEFEWKDSKLLPFSPCVYPATEATGDGGGGGREGEGPVESVTEVLSRAVFQEPIGGTGVIQPSLSAGSGGMVSQGFQGFCGPFVGGLHSFIFSLCLGLSGWLRNFLPAKIPVKSLAFCESEAWVPSD